MSSEFFKRYLDKVVWLWLSQNSFKTYRNRFNKQSLFNQCITYINKHRDTYTNEEIDDSIPSFIIDEYIV